MEKPWIKYKTMKVEFQSHYLDSGSFSLQVDAKRYAKEHGCSPSKFYDTKAFWSYVDEYCDFVTKYRAAIDFYSVVDIIGDPDRTWKVQQYMEDQGLHPIPVVHYRTDLKWLWKYMDRGHEYIAIGGLVGSHGQTVCRDWIDKVFAFVSDPDGFPSVKLHGFGVTSWALLLRYPWYSVDSASWLKVGGFGGVMMPPMRKARFSFAEPPYIVKCAWESPDRKKAGKHYLTSSPAEQSMFRQWLDRIEIPLGRMNEAGEILELGVMNDHSTRLTANMIYFEQLSLRIPEYPWRFIPSLKRGFGIIL